MKKIILAIMMFLVAGLAIYSYFTTKTTLYLFIGIAWVCIGIGYCIQNFGKKE